MSRCHRHSVTMWSCHMRSNFFVCDLYESPQSVQTSKFQTAFLCSWVMWHKDSLLWMFELVWVRVPGNIVTAVWRRHIVYPHEENIQSIICRLAQPGRIGRGERILKVSWTSWSFDVSRQERRFETKPTATSWDVFKCPPQQLGSMYEHISKCAATPLGWAVLFATRPNHRVQAVA